MNHLANQFQDSLIKQFNDGQPSQAEMYEEYAQFELSSIGKIPDIKLDTVENQ